MSAPPDKVPKPPGGRKRVRKYHPRGFSGCSTCKNRHVKCDEGTPMCNNCKRLGLQCDGPQGMSMFKMYDHDRQSKDAPRKGKRPNKSVDLKFETVTFDSKGVTTTISSSEPIRPRGPRSTPSNSSNQPLGSPESESSSNLTDSPLGSPDEQNAYPFGTVTSNYENAGGNVGDIASDYGDVKYNFADVTSNNGDFDVDVDAMDTSLAVVPYSDFGQPTTEDYKIEFNVPLVPSNWDATYQSHFLDSVASLLIIYDAPHNGNPFRNCLPKFAQSSLALSEVMKALGALHAANTTMGADKQMHMATAVAKYDAVLQAVKERWATRTARPRMEDLTVCLMLALYEMMDSSNDNWQVHLKGARDIYHLIFNANEGELDAEELEGMEADRPFRRFLVSLMSYMDVAGSLNTGDGTVVRGNYWESHGGWEYNLGVSDWINVSPADHVALTQLRQSWSILMSIQADTSQFYASKRSGTPISRLRQMRADLQMRLLNWSLNAPNCIHQVENIVDGGLFETNSLMECAGCVKAYERATLIYLHRTTAETEFANPEIDEQIEVATDRVLYLVKRLAHGPGQLGMLWGLYVAGSQVGDVDRQTFVRRKLTEMSTYGFNNVRRALENLELIWQKKHENPAYDWYSSGDFDRYPKFLMP